MKKTEIKKMILSAHKRQATVVANTLEELIRNDKFLFGDGSHAHPYLSEALDRIQKYRETYNLKSK